MSTDLEPCRSTLNLENEKFARDCNDKVSVRTIDDCAIDVLNQILNALGGGAGTPVHLVGEEVTATPGSSITLITTTVPASTTRTLNKLIITTRAAGQFFVDDGTNLIASGRTNAANLNAEFVYSPGLAVSAGTTITVKFIMLHGSTGQDVEAYLMALDT